MRVSPLCLLLFAAVTSPGQDLSSFDKVLLPVYNSREIHGANGSTFQSVAAVYPLAPVRYFPAPSLSNQPEIGTLLFGLTMWEAPVVAKGRFAFIERGSDWWVSEGVTNQAGSAQLPTIRERDALAGKSVLFPIPVTPILNDSNHLTGWEERNTLRIYDWSSTGDLKVNVRWRAFFIISMYELDEGVVEVNSRDFDHVSYPYYAEVDLRKLFPKHYCWFTFKGIECQAYSAIVEVEPVTPGARYYAFVSSTENATNRVTIYAPR